MPNFTSKNASESMFWNERFAENYMPWDGAGVPLELQQFVQDSEQAYSCFIPGCGLGYEVQYLVQHDWNVQAIDFAPAAVEKARLIFLNSRLSTKVITVTAHSIAFMNALFSAHFLLICVLPSSRNGRNFYLLMDY
jgi:hypothetical protein